MNLKIESRSPGVEFAAGQTMTEYVLIVSAIAIVLIGGYNAFGGTLIAMISSLSSSL
jgi:Flp pilus assembly pilin Flp